jgi:hypothetical protein
MVATARDLISGFPSLHLMGMVEWHLFDNRLLAELAGLVEC